MNKNYILIFFSFLCFGNSLFAQIDSLPIRKGYSEKNVTIELLVVEYEHGEQFEWGFDVTSGTVGRISNGGYSPGSSSPISLNYNFLGQLNPNFKLNLKALITDNYANIVTNPHISVKNNGKATLDAEEKQYLILQTASQYGVTSNLNVIKAGIMLVATPTIINDSVVDLNIDGEISEFIPTSSDGDRTIEVNQVKTNVRVNNGYSLIIGGLIKKEEIIIKQKIPLLGSIPLIGFLFRQDVKKIVYRELVIYITPHIHGSNNMPTLKLEKIGDDYLKENKQNYEENKQIKKLFKKKSKL